MIVLPIFFSHVQFVMFLLQKTEQSFLPVAIQELAPSFMLGSATTPRSLDALIKIPKSWVTLPERITLGEVKVRMCR